MKPVTYRPAAVKALRRMPANTAKRIVEKIEVYAENPATQANSVKKLQGRDGIRLRIGDWRVIMLDGEVLDVLNIGPRRGLGVKGTAMNRMVTIERAEYERLKTAEEELADIIAYDKAVMDGGEPIPAEYVKRLIDGESPLRVYRNLRGFTQAELSERSGVSRVQIAEIEAQRRSGSVETVRKLAEALLIAVDDLI